MLLETIANIAADETTNEPLRLAVRVIFMDAGRIIKDGPPTDMLGNPRSDRLRQFMAKVLYNRAIRPDPATALSARAGGQAI